MSLIYKHEARGGSAYKSATSRKGGVISDLFAEQRERRRMLIGFLPNKESIRGARANPMHFNSLRELASEEPSESG